MAALPTHIGRYEIKSLIGRGGMGDLYLAFDPNTNRLVALKLLNATLDSDELRQRFAREARALAALNHTNIVNIYDTGEFEDSPFIVMEYVRGETLAEMIKRKAALSVSQKLKLMAELCAGLAQAHEAGIIHRDIKPANLMVDQQGRLKILDFGIARVAEGIRARGGNASTFASAAHPGQHADRYAGLHVPGADRRWRGRSSERHFCRRRGVLRAARLRRSLCGDRYPPGGEQRAEGPAGAACDEGAGPRSGD